MDEVVVTTPTIGGNVEEVVYKNVRFVMWDLGGQGLIPYFDFLHEIDEPFQNH